MPLLGLLILAVELLTELLSTRKAARDVVTNVNDGARLRLGPQQMVEGDYAPGLRRWDGQATADVVEGAAADPANSILNRVECRQEQVALILDVSQTAARNPCLTLYPAKASDPS